MKAAERETWLDEHVIRPGPRLLITNPRGDAGPCDSMAGRQTIHQLVRGAAGVVASHTRPGGDTTPCAEDLAFTLRMAAAAAQAGPFAIGEVDRVVGAGGQRPDHAVEGVEETEVVRLLGIVVVRFALAWIDVVQRLVHQLDDDVPSGIRHDPERRSAAAAGIGEAHHHLGAIEPDASYVSAARAFVQAWAWCRPPGQTVPPGGDTLVCGEPRAFSLLIDAVPVFGPKGAASSRPVARYQKEVIVRFRRNVPEGHIEELDGDGTILVRLDNNAGLIGATRRWLQWSAKPPGGGGLRKVDESYRDALCKLPSDAYRRAPYREMGGFVRRDGAKG